MKRYNIIFIPFIIGIVLGGLGVLWTNAIGASKNEESNIDTTSINIVWRSNHLTLNKENLLQELKAQEVAFPEIVVAQALLETGNFKSASCTKDNNLFGLRNRNGSYMVFSHWTESVTAYKKYIQRWKNPPVDYYSYLKNLGYAENPNYTVILKQLVNKTK